MLFARIDLHSEKQHFSEKVKCFFYMMILMKLLFLHVINFVVMSDGILI